MKLSVLLTTSAIAALGFTISFLFLPSQYLSIFGLQADPATMWVSRYVGAAASGYIFLAWFSRNSSDSDARKAIVLAHLSVWGVAFVGLLQAQIAGMANTLGWGVVVICGLFALAFGYFQFMKPNEA